MIKKERPPSIQWGIHSAFHPVEYHGNLFHGCSQFPKITFENLGNTNVLFTKGLQCKKGRKNCKEIHGFRLYADNIKTFDLPYNGPAEYTYDIGGQLITKTFAQRQDIETYKENRLYR